MRIVGYERADFITKEGKSITGFNVWVSRAIDPRKGAGDAVDRIYFTDAKLADSGLTLDEALARNVTIFYSRFGKPTRIAIDD